MWGFVHSLRKELTQSRFPRKQSLWETSHTNALLRHMNQSSETEGIVKWSEKKVQSKYKWVHLWASHSSVKIRHQLFGHTEHLNQAQSTHASFSLVLSKKEGKEVHLVVLSCLSVYHLSMVMQRVFINLPEFPYMEYVCLLVKKINTPLWKGSNIITCHQLVGWSPWRMVL